MIFSLFKPSIKYVCDVDERLRGTNIKLINNDIEILLLIELTQQQIYYYYGKLGVIIGTFEHKLEQIK